MLRKLFILIAVSLGLAAAPASATLITVNFAYDVGFADATVVPATGLPAGSQFNGFATFDDNLIAGNQVIIDSLGGAGTFSLGFGSFNFNEADDLFGGPLLTLGAGNSLAALAFDTNFTIPAGAGAGNYLLSFSGNSFQLTPAGNTVDIRMQGTLAAVPEPATLAMLAAGLGLFGWTRHRRYPK